MPGYFYSQPYAQSGVKITCMRCYYHHIPPPGRLLFSNGPVNIYPPLHRCKKSSLRNDCSDELLKDNSHCLCSPSIQLCPQVFLVPVHVFYAPLKQTTGVLQQTSVPRKDSKTGRNSALARKSCIFVLDLQLLRHMSISICTPIFIKT